MSVIYAIKLVAGEPEVPCHLSELRKGDHFYRIDNGQRSGVLIMLSDPQPVEVNGVVTEWRIDCEESA